MPADEARVSQPTGAAGAGAAMTRLLGKLGLRATQGAPDKGSVETSLLRFAWRHSRLTQIGLLLLTFATFPLIYASLEIPKIVVNEAINGTDFPKDLLGVEVRQVPFLLLLCGAFLGLVVAINGLKWFLNVGIGMAGERMLRRLRFVLFQHIMRFPMKRFETMRQREMVQSIMGEVDQLGGFFGELFVTPLFQGGQLAVFITFIFVQDFWLGLAAISLYPIQAYIIPILQRRIIKLNKERVANTRALADRIGESIGNINEIRANGTVRWHLAQVSGRLHENTRIRYAIFERKFTIKFINNFLNQLTPFFFFSIGGYLVIIGELDFGALVAVLAAYKDLAGPWKALLNYFQRWSDFNSRFRFVVESFVVEDLWPAERLNGQQEGRLGGTISLRSVVAGSNGDTLKVERLEIPQGAHVALTGSATGARERLVRLLAGLDVVQEGRLTVGGRPLAEATLGEIGSSIGYVSQRPGSIKGTIRENAVYALYRQPPATAQDDGRLSRRAEAERTGNAPDDPDGDWIDYDAAGLTDAAALEERLIALTETFGLSENLYAVALGRQLTADQTDRWREPLLSLRQRVENEGEDIADLIEHWTLDRFNTNGSLLGNLLFGLPMPAEGLPVEPIRRADVTAVLEASGGAAVLEDVGWQIARELTDLAEAVGETSPVLDQLAGFSRQDVGDATALVAAGGAGETTLPASLRRGDRIRLRSLASRFVETRDQLEVLDDRTKAQILDCRRKAQPMLTRYGDFVRFDEPRYNPLRTVADNILHARRRYDRRSEWHRLDALLRRVIRDEGLWEDLLSIGLDVPLGEAGLSINAQRRLALVRAILKRPAILVMEGIGESAVEADAALRAAVFEALPETTILYVSTDEAAEGADMVVRIDDDGVKVRS
ncbi:MAG: ABC transporter transmembrane domain-containing protein [Pseudomonadota bacterium]